MPDPVRMFSRAYRKAHRFISHPLYLWHHASSAVGFHAAQDGSFRSQPAGCPSGLCKNRARRDSHTTADHPASTGLRRLGPGCYLSEPA